MKHVFSISFEIDRSYAAVFARGIAWEWFCGQTNLFLGWTLSNVGQLFQPLRDAD